VDPNATPSDPLPGEPSPADPQGQPDSPDALGQSTPLAEVQQQLRQVVNDAEAAREREAQRGSVQIEAPATAKTVAGGRYALSDPETQQRFEQARQGVRAVEPGRLDKAREFLATQRRRITREFQHLPRTAQFAPLRNDLLKLTKQGQVAQDTTLRAIQGITTEFTPELLELFEQKVVLDDLMFEAEQGRALPFGFTPDTLATDHAEVSGRVEATPEVREAIARRNALWDAVKSEYIESMADIGFNVGDRFQNPAYFRHQVLTHAALKPETGGRKKLKTPTGRGFLRRRQGSTSDINARYIEAEAEVMSQMLYDIEVAKVIKSIEDRYDVAPAVRAEATRRGVDFEAAVPEGFAVYQPREGDVFYRVATIPERTAMELLDQGISEVLSVPIDQVRTALAKGGPFKRMVLPNEVVDTLNDLRPLPVKEGFPRFWARMIRTWKAWVLINPRRVIPYNVRNLSGDIDAAIWNPRSLRQLPRAAQELYPAFFTNRSLPPEVAEWFKRGGMQAGLSAQELGDINDLTVFENLKDQARRATSPIAFGRVVDVFRLPTDYRESLLRYANYLEYLEQLERNGGVPDNYGASIREEIDALEDHRDKATKLANELVGAYDSIGQTGQWLRANLTPFWSWKEVNMRRYIGLARNAVADENMVEAMGKFGKAAGVKIPAATARVMWKFVTRGMALLAMAHAWNLTFFREEEEELDEITRGRAHIILGRNEDGSIRVFTRLGALEDAMQWFGGDIALGYVRDFISGRKSLKEVATQIASDPPDAVDVAGELGARALNEVIQLVRPDLKVPFELATGQQLFPDFRTSRPVRDAAQYVFRQLSLGAEYDAVSSSLYGKPSAPYLETLREMLWRNIDPGQGAYWDITNAAKSWLKETKGESRTSFFESPRGDALYNYKQAVRWDDERLQKMWLQRYLAEGGTRDQLRSSVQRGAPLAWMTESDRRKFVKRLGREERDVLKRAKKWYRETWPKGR
jgi:hypothetical protein